MHSLRSDQNGLSPNLFGFFIKGSVSLKLEEYEPAIKTKVKLGPVIRCRANDGTCYRACPEASPSDRTLHDKDEVSS